MHKPPEHLLNFGYSQLGDVWQLGLVFRVMLTGKAPFDQGSLLKCIVERRFQQALPNSVGEDIAGFVDRMTQSEPDKRPTCAELLRNPLFDKEKLETRQKRQLAIRPLSEWWAAQTEKSVALLKETGKGLSPSAGRWGRVSTTSSRGTFSSARRTAHSSSRTMR